MPGSPNTIATTNANRQIPENRIAGSSGVVSVLRADATEEAREADAVFDMASPDLKFPTRTEVAATACEVQSITDS
jgi:hypothetical protein